MYKIDKYIKMLDKNFLLNLLGKIIAALCFFFLDILIAKIGGYEVYSDWGFLYSIIIMTNWLFRFGIDASAKVHIASTEGKKRNMFFSTAFALQIVVALALGIISAVAVPVLQKIIAGEKMKGVLYLAILYSFSYALLCLLKESNLGYVKFERTVRLIFLEYFGYLILGILFLKIYGLKGIVIGFSVSTWISIIYGMIQQKNEIRLKFIDWRIAKEIMIQAKFFAIGNIGGLVLTEMDTFMLGTYYISDVGIYSVAKQLIAKATNIPLALCTSEVVKFSNITSATELNRKTKLKQTLFRLSSLCAIILLGIGFLGKVYIKLLYGEQYYKSYIIMIALFLYFYLYSITSFLSMFLQYQKKGKTLSKSYILVVFSNIVLNYALIPRLGALGAAVASSISMVPYCLYLIIVSFSLVKQ